MTAPGAPSDPFAPPVDPAGLSEEPRGAWQDDDLVVVEPNGTLSPRCFVCGTDAAGMGFEVVHWRPPATALTYVAFALSLLPFAALSSSGATNGASCGALCLAPVVAALNTRHRWVAIPLCDAHRAMRLRTTLLAGALVAGLVVLFLIPATNPSLRMLTLVGIPGTLWLWRTGVRVASAARIEAGSMHLRGAAAPFLATLPQAPAPLVLLRTEDEL
jgi:hypothetical protein